MRKDKEFSCECVGGCPGTCPARTREIQAGGDHLESTASLKQGEWVGPIGREVGETPTSRGQTAEGEAAQVKKKGAGTGARRVVSRWEEGTAEICPGVSFTVAVGC